MKVIRKIKKELLGHAGANRLSSRCSKSGKRFERSAFIPLAKGIDGV